mgnify:CR=1 FL=1
MGKLRGLLLLLISVMVFSGCKETPSSNESVSTFTELEVRNNSGNVDTWFVIGVGVNGKSLYNYTNGTEIRHGEWRRFSFTKDDVGGDLTDLIVGIRLQISNGSTQRDDVSTRLDFTLGERRVVRIDCVSFYNNERCRTDGLVLTSVE